MTYPSPRRTLRLAVRVVLVATLCTWSFLACYAIGAASNANAETSDSSAAAAAEAPDLEQRRTSPQTSLASIEPGVMCPTCDAPLAQSNSPAASRMREWIRTAVAAGWTEEEIRVGLVEEYGGDESILAVPGSGTSRVLTWGVPAVVAAFALSMGSPPSVAGADGHVRSRPRVAGATGVSRMPRILLLCRDLMTASRIEAAVVADEGVQVVTVGSIARLDAVLAGAADGDLVVAIDLDGFPEAGAALLEDPARRGAGVVAFAPHVHEELLATARAWADVVAPRGAAVRSIAALAERARTRRAAG